MDAVVAADAVPVSVGSRDSVDEPLCAASLIVLVRDDESTIDSLMVGVGSLVADVVGIDDNDGVSDGLGVLDIEELGVHVGDWDKLCDGDDVASAVGPEAVAVIEGTFIVSDMVIDTVTRSVGVGRLVWDFRVGVRVREAVTLFERTSGVSEIVNETAMNLGLRLVALLVIVLPSTEYVVDSLSVTRTPLSEFVKADVGVACVDENEGDSSTLSLPFDTCGVVD